MREEQYKQVMENYKKSCRQKTEFAKKYIKDNSINCGSCKLEECNFIKPPYECETSKVYIEEILPPTISVLSEKSILANKIWREN